MPQVTDSSRIVNIDWDNGILSVTFRGGDQYEYEDIPNGLYQEFLAAESKGKFLDAEIKGKFNYAKV